MVVQHIFEQKRCSNLKKLGCYFIVTPERLIISQNAHRNSFASPRICAK